MEASKEPKAPAIDFAKDLGFVAPAECKKCKNGKCDPLKVAHCCDHELSESDESRIFFLGAIFHELSHFVAATLAGIEVLAYKLWQPEVAWVRTQIPQKSFNEVFISIAPLLFGSIVSGLLLISLFATHMWDGDPVSFLILLYLAISIAVHSPISKVDVYSMAIALGLSYLRRKQAKGILARLSALLVWPFYFIAASLYKLSRFWFVLVQYLFLIVVFGLLSTIMFVK